MTTELVELSDDDAAYLDELVERGRFADRDAFAQEALRRLFDEDREPEQD
jgi:Arc/MetJ-type ribon-helix-helix transcriptional regulator